MEKPDVGTVLISTEEYLEDKFEIFHLKERIEELKADLDTAVKCYQSVADAIRSYVRKDSKYGAYQYLSKETKELLEAICEDPNTFDLTVRPESEVK